MHTLNIINRGGAANVMPFRESFVLELKEEITLPITYHFESLRASQQWSSIIIFLFLYEYYESRFSLTGCIYRLRTYIKSENDKVLYKTASD